MRLKHFTLILGLAIAARPLAGQTQSFFRTSPGIDGPVAVAADASGIYVVGNSVRKYDSSGNELWTRVFSGFRGPGFGAAADATGVYVIGLAQGSTGPQSVLRKYSTGGADMWTRQEQFPIPSAGVATDASGVYVAHSEGYRHFLNKYSAARTRYGALRANSDYFPEADF